MLLPLTSKVKKNGHLMVGDVDVISLGQNCGTPLYIVDIATIKEQCREYIKNFNFTGLDAEIIYASKAFNSIAMCQLIKEQGLSIDVSTGGELYIALESGFDPEKIYFHGNNKSAGEIEYGLACKVGCFIVDNFSELKTLAEMCSERNIRQNIMLRITPGVKASTHEYIQTGKVKSKFGFGIHGGVALEAVKKVSEYPGLDLVGLHAHIGSQIFNLSCYDKLIEVMIKLLKTIKDDLGTDLKYLNIGGGLGVKYMPYDRPSTIYDLSRVVHDAVEKYSAKFDHKLEKIYLEPGRSITGNAGITLYQVGVVKEIAGVKNYVAIDGGMSDNIRPILYQAKYNAYLANRMEDSGNMNKSDMKHYSIVGKHCESGDVIIDDIKLPPVRSGDFIAVATTGAYCYSMASNYNGQPKSAVAAVEDGNSWIWIKRQSYQDLVIGDKKLYER